MVSSRHNLFELTHGWKSPLIPFDYPKPLKVSRLDSEGDQAFADVEDKWLEELDARLYQRLCEAHSSGDTLTEEDQNTFLTALEHLCVDEACRIWTHPSFKRSHKHSKEEGILIGKLAWIRRALDGAITLEKAERGAPHNAPKVKAATAKMAHSYLLPELTFKEWSSATVNQRETWKSKLSKQRQILRIELQALEEIHRAERRAKAESFQIREGTYYTTSS